MANDLVGNLEKFRLEDFFQAVAVVREEHEKGEEVVPRLMQDIEKVLEQSAREHEGVPSVEQVGPVLEVAARTENEVWKRWAEKILAGWVKGAKDERAIVSLIYNMAVFALEADDPDVGRYLAELSVFEKEYLRADSAQARRIVLGNYSPDDEVLGMSMDVDCALRLLRDRYAPELEALQVERYRSQIDDEQGKREMREIIEADPERFRVLAEYYLEEAELAAALKGKNVDSVALQSKFGPDEFPANLVFRPSRLRRIYTRRL